MRPHLAPRVQAEQSDLQRTDARDDQVHPAIGHEDWWLVPNIGLSTAAAAGPDTFCSLVMGVMIEGRCQ